MEAFVRNHASPNMNAERPRTFPSSQREVRCDDDLDASGNTEASGGSKDLNGNTETPTTISITYVVQLHVRGAAGHRVEEKVGELHVRLEVAPERLVCVHRVLGRLRHDTVRGESPTPVRVGTIRHEVELASVTLDGKRLLRRDWEVVLATSSRELGDLRANRATGAAGGHYRDSRREHEITTNNFTNGPRQDAPEPVQRTACVHSLAFCDRSPMPRNTSR